MDSRAGRLLIDGSFVPGRVVFDGGRIVRVEEDPAPGAEELPIVAPGLVDLHVHGFGGHEPLDDLGAMAGALARAGTTAFLPTLFPRAPEPLGEDAEAVWSAARELGGRVPGLHLEGPFVNPEAIGGLPPDGVFEPSPEALRAILGSASGDGRGVRAMTLAPELAGGGALIDELVRAGVRVSLGHSLARTAEAWDAVRRGATGATHLFNAMRPLHHREAGIVGVALTADELVVEIIGDLTHVGPEAFELALRARGPEGLCLVSDMLAGAGTDARRLSSDAPARFCSHGRECFVADGAAWYEDPDAPDGRRLTGSVTCQLEAVRGLVARGIVAPADALRMASETPARALGVEAELGRITPGARADLLVLAGPDLELVEVLVGGEPLA
ncbi:MAG: amidohydrolase family protein [Planctomycetota bacterium]|nr:amidohydrolase family protein [Planctomycetota bacterium]